MTKSSAIQRGHVGATKAARTLQLSAGKQPMTAAPPANAMAPVPHSEAAGPAWCNQL